MSPSAMRCIVRRWYGLAERMKAVRTIVGTPENNLLRAYPGVFHCPGWMSMCLFNRWPFCLFLLMEGARAGKNKSNGHA